MDLVRRVSLRGRGGSVRAGRGAGRGEEAGGQAPALGGGPGRPRQLSSAGRGRGARARGTPSCRPAPLASALDGVYAISPGRPPLPAARPFPRPAPPEDMAYSAL